MARGLTPLTTKTFEDLQYDSGIFIVGYDITKTPTYNAAINEIYKIIAGTPTTAGAKCLGALKGGGTYADTAVFRSVELDGMRNAFKGSMVMDSRTQKLTGTMTEMSPENLELIMPGAEIDTENSTDDMKVMRFRTYIDTEKDYIKKIGCVLEIGKGLIYIELDNALNTAGTTLTFADKGNGTLPFELTATQGEMFSKYTPCRLIWLLDRSGNVVDPGETP